MTYFSVVELSQKWTLVCLGFLSFMIVGCAQNEPGSVPTVTFEGELIPYLTSTQTHSQDQSEDSKIFTPSPTDFPVPTSTPFLYEVVENDTLTGIAIKHSVSLEDLIASNPEIDPNFLTIGLTLTIPLDGIVSQALPTSTPIPIQIQPPVCYPRIDGNLQCMSVIKNDQTFSVENAVVMISLQSQDGDEVVSKIAISPLNIIQAGKKVVVSALFETPIISDYLAHANLLSVIPVSPEDQRYLESVLSNQDITISADGKSANITGMVEILSEQSGSEGPTSSTIWVSAFAYDSQNNVVGYRKWIAESVPNSSNEVNFKFGVYSLGPAIDHVDILTEARP